MTIYHLYATKENIGDYLSALAIKGYLKIKMKDLFWSREYFSKTSEIICDLKENDIIIIGGGGLFKDFFSPMWNAIIKYYSGYKLIIWGVGECDIKQTQYTGLPDSLIESISKITTKIAVRDISTQKRFINQGILPEMVGCPSTTIGLSWPKRKENYLLHVTHTGILKNELPLWRESCRNLALKLNMEYVELTHIFPKSKIRKLLYFTKLKCYYENAGLIVSSRLHGIILGATRGVPVIPVSNDHKIESYWKGTLGGDVVLNKNDFNLIQNLVYSELYDPPEKILDNAKKVTRLNDKYSQDVKSIIKA